MKRFNLFKSLAVTLAVAAMMTLMVNAQQSENSKEVKLKTNVANAVVKNKIETITNALKGISESDFSISEKTLTVKYNPDEINTDMLVHVLKLVGYDTEIIDAKEGTDKTRKKTDSKELGLR